MKKKILIIVLAFFAVSLIAAGFLPSDTEEPAEPSAPVWESNYEDGSDKQAIEQEAFSFISSNFSDTTVTGITVNDDLGTNVDGDYILLVYADYTKDTDEKSARKTMEGYSKDLADDMNDQFETVMESVVFWTADNAGISGKCQLVKSGETMKKGDIVWLGK